MRETTVVAIVLAFIVGAWVGSETQDYHWRVKIERENERMRARELPPITGPYPNPTVIGGKP